MKDGGGAGRSIGMRRARWVVACILGAVLLAACGGRGAPPPDDRSTTSTTIATTRAEAIERAEQWLGSHLESVDNSPSLMFVDYVGRNWSIPSLAPQAHQVAQQRTPSGLSLLIWRLIDPSFPAGQQFSEPGGTQELLSAALYCDRYPPGPGFNRTVDSFTRDGGYSASHAGIALQWVREHGCALDGLEQRIGAVVDVLADELDSATVVDDKALEAGAVLVYLGAADRVPSAFVNLGVRQQHADGGWGINSPEDPSNWHPTVFGLWMLLGVVDGPGSGATMMSPATGTTS